MSEPVQENASPALLADYTTLGLGGPARHFVSAGTEADLTEAVHAADQAGEPVLLIGGGSNLVVSDAGFPGTAIHVNTRGISFARGDEHRGDEHRGDEHRADEHRGDEHRADEHRADEHRADEHRADQYGADESGAAETVDVTVAAGHDWDDVVAATVAEGLAGLEPLSGIPGRAGATPIQNVGAYGREVAEVITQVRVYDRQEDNIQVIPNEACSFSYRTSLFKSGRPAALVAAPSPAAGQPRYVVLDVTFRLARQSLSAPVGYAELAAELGVAMGEQAAAAEVRAAVIKIRGRKGMVLNPGDPDTRSAGSFFTNPVITAAQFARVEAQAAARGIAQVPHYPAADGLVKVPAAWLIEHSGFAKGYGAPGPARVSAKHTLALVNADNATATDLLALAREIVSGVHAAYGVPLTPEPILIGLTL